MAITLPCQSAATLATEACTILGMLTITDAAPVSGEGDFDAVGPWTLSNYDTSGFDISSNYARLVAADALHVRTSTGEQYADVVDVTVGADTTVINITPVSAAGTLDVGDNTAVWVCVPKI